MGAIVKHVEEHHYELSEEDLQRILFDYFKIKTGNYSKVNILERWNGSVVKFPLHVMYEELLEHDHRIKLLDLTPKKAE